MLCVTQLLLIKLGAYVCITLNVSLARSVTSCKEKMLWLYLAIRSISSRLHWIFFLVVQTCASVCSLCVCRYEHCFEPLEAVVVSFFACSFLCSLAVIYNWDILYAVIKIILILCAATHKTNVSIVDTIFRADCCELMTFFPSVSFLFIMNCFSNKLQNGKRKTESLLCENAIGRLYVPLVCTLVRACVYEHKCWWGAVESEMTFPFGEIDDRVYDYERSMHYVRFCVTCAIVVHLGAQCTYTHVAVSVWLFKNRANTYRLSYICSETAVVAAHHRSSFS